jgi:hypothetical protein
LPEQSDIGLGLVPGGGVLEAALGDPRVRAPAPLGGQREAGATGLEPATSGVTGRRIPWSFAL